MKTNIIVKLRKLSILKGRTSTNNQLVKDAQTLRKHLTSISPDKAFHLIKQMTPAEDKRVITLFCRLSGFPDVTKHVLKSDAAEKRLANLREQRKVLTTKCSTSSCVKASGKKSAKAVLRTSKTNRNRRRKP